jgi:hypothetical protein
MGLTRVAFIAAAMEAMAEFALPGRPRWALYAER